MTKKIKVYQWQIEQAQMDFRATDPNREPHPPLDLIAEIKNSFNAAQRADLNRKLFDLAVKHDPSKAINRARIYFDGGQIVYSLDPLKTATIIVSADSSQDSQAFLAVNSMVAGVLFMIASTEKQVLLGDIPKFDQATADAPAHFRPLQQFIETATTEHALQTGRYMVTRGGACYDLNDEDQVLIRAGGKLPAGTYFAGGAQKTARIVEGKGGSSVQASLAVKAIATPFHVVQSVADKVLGNHPNFLNYRNGQLSGVEVMLKGLKILPLHRPNVSRCMEISSLDFMTSRERMIVYEDGRPDESIFGYFLRHHGFEIEHPDLPLLIVKDKIGDKKQYLPMSVCEVADNQPLKGEYAKSMASQVLSVNCVLPAMFERNTLRAVRAVEFDNSQCLGEAGISIGGELTQIDARVLPPPDVIFDKGRISKPNTVTSNWRAGNYYFGSEIRIWALWVVERPTRGPNARRFDGKKLEAFGAKFLREARKRGITIAEPADTRIFNIPVNGGSEFDQLQLPFVEAGQAGCQFIMMLTDLEDKAVHSMLKKFELQCQVVTQNVTLKTVNKFMSEGGNMETLNNVVQKTNEKCGGTNYLLGDSFEGKHVGTGDLFVGIATNQLTGEVKKGDGSDQASVIGYSANDQKNVAKFTGDYIFADPFRNEVAGVVKPILDKVLTRYNANRGSQPERIFLYLNGMAEGTYSDLLKYVIPLARAAIKSKGCKAPLTVINGTKLHNVRLIPSNIPPSAVKAREQNVKPGTVVDTNIVSPLYDEFYLVSHASSLGTACPPRFSVVCNDGMLPADAIQLITYYLACAFQIINRNVSMPAPIQIALEMAKRGRMNLNSATTLSDSAPTGSQNNYERLTDHLSYGDRPLRNSRFNA